jgi:CheY-like chemotaxis protein
VIDDDAAVRQAIRAVLEAQDYAVDEACNGHDALERVRTRVPQLILCDIFMPNQDGFDTIRALRRECPAVPIVAMSGGGSIGGSDALRMARHLGAADVLHKPLHHAGLLGVIERLVPDR